MPHEAERNLKLQVKRFEVNDSVVLGMLERMRAEQFALQGLLTRVRELEAFVAKREEEDSKHAYDVLVPLDEWEQTHALLDKLGEHLEHVVVVYNYPPATVLERVALTKLRGEYQTWKKARDDVKVGRGT